jgi:hypothetical protein
MAKSYDDLWDEAFYEHTMGEGDFEDIFVRKIIENDQDTHPQEVSKPDKKD